MKGEPFRHDLFEFDGLLEGVDLDQRLFRHPYFDPVPPFDGAQHLQLLDLFELAGRKRAEPLEECRGIAVKPEMDEHRQKLIDQKREEYENRQKQTDAFAKSHYPQGAQLCLKCSTAAVVMMDGCMTCLNCGDSKCG